MNQANEIAFKTIKAHDPTYAQLLVMSTEYCISTNHLSWPKNKYLLFKTFFSFFNLKVFIYWGTRLCDMTLLLSEAKAMFSWGNRRFFCQISFH